MRVTTKYLAPTFIAIAALTLVGCAPTTPAVEVSGSSQSAAPVQVGMVTSVTGPLAAYGAEYKAGFEAGLSYSTGGTGAVNGRSINVTWKDDQGVAATAVSDAKDLIGQGYNILGGTVDSGIAIGLAQQALQNKVLYLSGPAAADAITGANKYTFRSGRQSYQDVATAGTFIGSPSGKKVVVFAQDGAFGQGNLAAVKNVLGTKGAFVSSVLVPASTTEFTPFAQQLLDAKPDLIFVAWAGATTAAMWQALEQQNVFAAAPIVTGLATTATYNAYGPVSDKIDFLSHYFPGATSNPAEKAMDAALKKAGATPDLFSPDGFVAAQMVVQAVKKGGGTDVNKMITSLENWSFDSVKGTITVRAGDHAMIQPMFQAKLVKNSTGSWLPKLVKAVSATSVAPPLASK